LAKIFIGVYLNVRTRGGDIMKTLKQILNDKKYQEVISIAPNRPVFDALVVLAEYKIGALAVIDDGQLVGIFPSATTRVRLYSKAAPPEPPWLAR